MTNKVARLKNALNELSKYKITNVEYIWNKIWVWYMYISRSDLSSVALEPNHKKSKIQSKQMKHSNPNQSKLEAKSDGRDNF